MSKGKRGGVASANALAAFHHAVAQADMEKVKAFVQGVEGKPTSTKVAVNAQDDDGLAAVHWAAMKGHKDVLKYLIEGAPENNRADPTLLDKDSWSPLMWAVFMAETTAKETSKRKSQCDVINYLVKFDAVNEQLHTSDRLLHKTPKELALDVARQTDEAIVVAVKGTWESSKTYGPLKEDGKGRGAEESPTKTR